MMRAQTVIARHDVSWGRAPVSFAEAAEECCIKPD